MDRMKEKVALVTGGAMGLGEAMCRLLAKEGAKVVLTDIKEAEGQATAAAIAKAGGTAFFLAQDVRSEERWKEVTAETIKRFGRLDVLVNNAGVVLMKNVEQTTFDEWKWLHAINLDAVFLGTKYGIAAMKEGGGGSIVNLSSIEGIIADENLFAYNSSKGGVRLLTKSAALHCAKAGYNIRVNSVHPGYIATPMVAQAIDELGGTKEIRRHIESLHPMGHIGEPYDIAYGVLYLASDESKFMTGAELVIDGGYTAR
ncbi:MAG: glucose 1-dehydrogenase [Pseudomonadota bacterium]